MSSAALCVADVTGGNPNVMWEVGFVAALKKPLVVINQSERDLPFDIADLRAVMYDRSALAKTLKEPLIEAIRETLKRYSFSSSTALRKTRRRIRQPSLAVTGTMVCPPEQARRRMELVLQPYLGKKAAWFIGSFGTVDEVTLRILLDAGEENVTVVGYSSYDISGPVLSMIEDSENIEFIDSIAEQMPKTDGAPSVRDVLMAARCDTFIVGWDGESQGTRELIRWLSGQGKDHLVAFVTPLHAPLI